jgi:hypothetical protein
MKPSEKRIGVVPVLRIPAADPPPVYYAEPVCLPTCYWTRGRPVREGHRGIWIRPRIQVCDRESYFFRLHFSAYDLAQNAMREKQAMRKIMKTTFSIARMYRSDKFAAR